MYAMVSIYNFLDGIEYNHITYNKSKKFHDLTLEIQNQNISDEHFQQIIRAERAIVSFWSNNTMVKPSQVKTLKKLIKGSYDGKYAQIGENSDSLNIPISNSEDIKKYHAMIPLKKYCDRIRRKYTYGEYTPQRYRW